MPKRSKPARPITYYFPDPPVESRPERLPLHDPNWTWGQFEAFCRDLVGNLPGVVRCQHYGKGGSRQKGIDLYAEFEDGRRWTFQCKQRREFGRADVERAIAKNAFTADRHVLVLSTELGSEARDACDAHPCWEAWDVRDLSVRVRQLCSTNRDVAVRIVEDHFGKAWRRAFLGLPGLRTFLSPYDFFRSSLDPRHIFNHTFDLVGREELVEEMDSFVRDGRRRVLIIRGRGGIGKTKLLHAFSRDFVRRFPGYSIRFVPDGVPIDRDSYDEMSDLPLVVVVDDAHRRDRGELGMLLAIARQRDVPLKLVFSLRPSGYDSVLSRSVESGCDASQIAPPIDVKELNRTEVRGLAAQVLGAGHSRFADRLADVTRDCPLVTVIGGRLLADRSVPPELLERHDEFRTAALAKFGDEIVGRVSDRIEPGRCLAVMRVLSAIMPLGPLDCDFGDEVAGFLGVDRASLIEALGILEEVGVVLRRGRSLRLTPDVFADHVLHNACLTANGQETGFIGRVFAAFGRTCQPQLLRNLAELDWRVNATRGIDRIDLLSRVWDTITSEFAGADASGRVQILEALTDFSSYQPAHILGLADFAMKNPTPDAPDPAADRFRPSHRNVLAGLVPLLHRAAYSPEHLPVACDLLWRLGRDDTGAVSPRDHGLGALAELAGYEAEKPVDFLADVLLCIERWADAADASPYLEKLCGLIDPVLEKTGYSSRTEGAVIQMMPFYVDERNTRGLHDRAIALLARFLDDEDPRVCLRAVESLRKVLCDPFPPFGLPVTDDVVEAWGPEQLKVLDILEGLLGREAIAIAKLRAVGFIRWASRQARNQAVRDRASSILDEFEPDLEFRLAELLAGDHSHLLESEDYDGDVEATFKRRQERLPRLGRAIAGRLIERHPDPRDGLRVLSDALDQVRLASPHGQPVTFLSELCEIHFDYAVGLCEAIIESSGCSMASHLDILVSAIRRTDPEKAIGILRRCLRTDEPALWYAAASTYYRPVWLDSARDGDVALLETLLGCSNLVVRRVAIGGLSNLGKVRPAIAKGLALAIDLSGDIGLAEELFMRLETGIGVPLEDFEDREIDVLLGKLSPLGDLDKHSINQFLVLASGRRPWGVLRLLMDRVDSFTWGLPLAVDPLPTLGFARRLDGFARDPGYPEMLRQVRDRALERNRPGRFLVPKLFRELTLNFTTDYLPVLDEWIEDGHEDRLMAVAELLRESPHDLVFEQAGLVEKLLDAASAVGEACYRQIAGLLSTPSVIRGRQGVVGQPFPQDVALRDRASAMANTCRPGSPAWRFYMSLAESAEGSIRRKLDDDAAYD